MKSRAIYAGTFDPITAGHLDVLSRAASMYGEVVLAVGTGEGKKTMFSAAERVDMANAAVAEHKNVKVEPLDGLLVEFARKHDISVLVRGVRAASDLDYEIQMASMNRKLAPEIETVFLVPDETLSCISSSLVREIARQGGDISSFVPQCVADRIKTQSQE